MPHKAQLQLLRYHGEICVFGHVARSSLICRIWDETMVPTGQKSVSCCSPCSPHLCLRGSSTACMHTSVCLSVCMHKINELCVCIVRVHRPVYILEMWLDPGRLRQGFCVALGVGKRGDLFSQLLRPLHWTNGGPHTTPNLPPPPLMPTPPLSPCFPIHSAACCLSADPRPSLRRSVRHLAAPHHRSHHQPIMQPPRHSAATHSHARGLWDLRR